MFCERVPRSFSSCVLDKRSNVFGTLHSVVAAHFQTFLTNCVSDVGISQDSFLNGFYTLLSTTSKPPERVSVPKLEVNISPDGFCGLFSIRVDPQSVYFIEPNVSPHLGAEKSHSSTWRLPSVLTSS